MSDPEAARVLLDPQALRYFEPFLAREGTVGEVAAALGCKPNSLLARVRRFLTCGLLEVVREVPRAGRAIRVYRSTADVYFVPLSGSPFEDHAVWAQERAALVQQGLRFGHAQSARLRGHRVYRDEHGVVTHVLAVSAQENHDPLVPSEPALFTASHDAVYLNFEDAKQLQGELDALLRRYAMRGGGQRYLLWLNLVPLPG